MAAEHLQYVRLMQSQVQTGIVLAGVATAFLVTPSGARLHHPRSRRQQMQAQHLGGGQRVKRKQVERDALVGEAPFRGRRRQVGCFGQVQFTGFDIT